MNYKDKIDLVTKLKSTSDREGLTGTGIAQQLGVASAVVGKYLREEVLPTTANCAKIEAFLKLTTEQRSQCKRVARVKKRSKLAELEARIEALENIVTTPTTLKSFRMFSNK